MSRSECQREMIFAMTAGNLITAVLLAFLHDGLTAGEVMAFWMATWFIATYCAWSVIDWADRHKENRRGGQATCGKDKGE